MGPLDSRAASCSTCGMTFAFCPGHCGHIELEVPVCDSSIFFIFILLNINFDYLHRL